MPTDEGLCYSFNAENVQKLFKESAFIDNLQVQFYLHGNLHTMKIFFISPRPGEFTISICFPKTLIPALRNWISTSPFCPKIDKSTESNVPLKNLGHGLSNARVMDILYWEEELPRIEGECEHLNLAKQILKKAGEGKASTKIMKSKPYYIMHFCHFPRMKLTLEIRLFSR